MERKPKFEEYLKQERELTSEEASIVNFTMEKFYDYCENPPSDLTVQELSYRNMDSKIIKTRVLDEVYIKWKEFFDVSKQSPEEFMKEKSTFFYESVMNFVGTAEEAGKKCINFIMEVEMNKSFARDVYESIKKAKASRENLLKYSEIEPEIEL